MTGDPHGESAESSQEAGVELQHFLHGLHRRHVRRVFRALATYGIVAAALVEVTEPIVHALHLPEWTLTFVVIVLGLGFPVVAVIAWASSDAAAPAPAEAPAGPIAGSADRPAPARRRMTPRVAAALVGVGLLVAAPGLAYYVFLRGRSGHRGGPAVATASIAVLPFSDLSAGRDQEYFADGIAEEILNALVHVDGLRVAGRTSSFSFKNKPATIPEIGHELNVATVLAGSVRKEGNRVRVTAELVDAGRGDHVWSENYDRELTGIFAVQDEIARAVVEALKVKILPGHGPMVQPRHTTSPEAYNSYLLGKHFFDLATPDDMRRAVKELEKATALDPRYAPAWAWLSVSILNSAVYLARPDDPATEVEDAARRAIAAADRAVALAPDLPESWSARAWMRTSLTWEWDGATADFDRALALAPRDANILVRKSHLLAVLGRLPEAMATARKVIEIDPLYSWGWDFLSGFELGSGRPDLAREYASRALDLAPDHIYSRMTLGISNLLLGHPQEALAEFEKEKSEALRLVGSALAQRALGSAVEEEKAFAALRARFSDAEPYAIAAVYSWRGERDRALEWLDRAVAQRGGRGVSRLLIRRIKWDPLLANVRGDPRYAALVRRMGLPPAM
jgi:TolB-like protein/tetratricopeptide (TPR) repeat protein